MEKTIRLVGTIRRGESHRGKWIEYFIDPYGNKKVIYSGKYRKRFGDSEDGRDSIEWQMAGYLYYPEGKSSRKEIW